MRTWIVYALVDPRTEKIRYVGVTYRSVERRLLEHRRQALGNRTKRKPRSSHWFKSLLDAGVEPVIEVLETCGEDWAAREVFWISQFENLVNHTSGGEGTPGYVPPEDVRAKHRSRMLGKRVSEETKEKLRQANLGRKAAPETCAKISAALTGIRRSPETIERCRIAKKGAQVSMEQRARISATMKGVKFSPERLAACRARWAAIKAQKAQA